MFFIFFRFLNWRRTSARSQGTHLKKIPLSTKRKWQVWISTCCTCSLLQVNVLPWLFFHFNKMLHYQLFNTNLLLFLSSFPPLPSPPPPGWWRSLCMISVWPWMSHRLVVRKPWLIDWWNSSWNPRAVGKHCQRRRKVCILKFPINFLYLLTGG